MSKLSKLFVAYLFFVILGLTPSELIPPQTPKRVNVVAEVSTLYQEQEAIAGHLADKYAQPKALVSRIVKTAYAEGKRIGLSPLTLLAIIEKESGFRPDVVNYYGAVGLMQVVPRFHKDKVSSRDAVAQLQQPELNIHVGATIISEYLVAKDGNISEALAKYSGNAKKYTEKVAYFEGKLFQVQLRSNCTIKGKGCFA